MHASRRLFPALALVFTLGAGTAFAFTPSGLLEIHHVNVQQGDCTLIIGPDGTTLLIDGGNAGKGDGEVVPYLQSLGLQPADGLDYMLATHRDADHLGGLDEVIQAGYDVRLNVWDNGSNKSTNQIDQFLDAASTTTAGSVTAIPLGTVIALGDGATATCVAVHGDVIGSGPVPGVSNENDLSVAILVQYKDFDYITAGDLGGGDWNDDFNCTGRSTSQRNVESPLAISLMPGGASALLTADGVEVLDVNHHGSESSTNSEWMNLLTPAVAVINVGAGQGSNFHHPRQDVVESVLLAGGSCITAEAALVLQTEEGSPTGSNTSFAGHCSGDVIVKTTGVGTYEVSGTGQVSQGPDERVQAGIDPPANIAIDGATGGDTEAPVVMLNVPNGGESWDAGTTQNVTWTATDNVGVTSIDLFYSTTGAGGPFTTIAAGEPNDGVFPWTVPDDPSTDAFVKVVARDAAGNSAEDLSDAPFTITGSGTTPELVINEIMQNPDAVSDTDGEWFELFNPGTSGVDIDGWTIRDDGSDTHVIANGGPLVVPAGGYLVLGRNGDSGTNGGYTADYVYSSFLLANTDDEVVIEDPSGTIVDQVAYTGTSPWPNPTGASMELSDPALDNADGSNWAVATARGGTFTGGGDLGTPGAANGGSSQQTELHVHGLTVDNVALNGNRWRGRATVTVHDQDHAPVSGVEVTGDWSGNTSESGKTATTDGSGVAVLESKGVKNPSSVFCFDVTALDLANASYDPAADVPQTPPAVCGPSIPSSPSILAFAVESVGPNPFRSGLTVRFRAAEPGRVALSVYDVRGRRVATLRDGPVSPGEHAVSWRGRSDGGARLTAGLYLLRFESPAGVQVRRLILLP